MEKPKHPHAGHRKRMRELVDKVGLESLNEIQALEFVLTYVFPRKNTNEIAHSLLDVFGSFAHVLNAEPSELEKIPNFGQDSAKMLSQMKYILTYYKKSLLKERRQLKNILEINAYFYNLLESVEIENMYVMALDSKGLIIALKRLAVGTDKLLTIDKREVVNFAFSNKATKIVLAHNHPVAPSTPSRTDDENTAALQKWLNAVNIELVDHVVVGLDGTFSFKEVKYFSIEKLQGKII